jgi:hypothetical protein
MKEKRDRQREREREREGGRNFDRVQNKRRWVMSGNNTRRDLIRGGLN